MSGSRMTVDANDNLSPLEVSAPSSSLEPSPPSPSSRQSLPLLYCLIVGTFGFYSIYWIWKTAKALDVRKDSRWGPQSWAIGSLIPIVCAFVLAKLYDRAKDNHAEDGSSGGLAVGGAYALIWMVLVLTKTVGLLALPPVFLALPFLAVQHAVNEASRPSAKAPRYKRVAAFIMVGIGIPSSQAVLLYVDAPELALRVSPAEKVNTPIPIPNSPITVTLPKGKWVRSSSDLDDDAAALEVVSQKLGVQVTAFVTPGLHSLDDITNNRLAVIEEAEYEILSMEETRFFLDEERFVFASRRTYNVTTIFEDAAQYVVLSVVLPKQSIEVIAHTESPKNRSKILQQLINDVDIAWPEDET